MLKDGKNGHPLNALKTLSILIIYYVHKYLFSLVEDHDSIQHHLYAPGALEDYRVL